MFFVPTIVALDITLANADGLYLLAAAMKWAVIMIFRASQKIAYVHRVFSYIKYKINYVLM
jgi:hypothetical protein